jgi:hypothetical protein
MIRKLAIALALLALALFTVPAHAQTTESAASISGLSFDGAQAIAFYPDGSYVRIALHGFGGTSTMPEVEVRLAGEANYTIIQNVSIDYSAALIPNSTKITYSLDVPFTVTTQYGTHVTVQDFTWTTQRYWNRGWSSRFIGGSEEISF